MRFLISLTSLFASVILLQLAIGSVGPLDALSGGLVGFSTTQIGLIGSAHFLGFLIGCWWTPRLMGNIGASRTFAVLTAIGTIGMMAHMMIVTVPAWAVFRVLIGICVSGAYTVIEAWLNEKADNQNRGRVTASYRVVDMGASLFAQLLVAGLSPATYLAYNTLAILCCAALIPIALAKAGQPAAPASLRLRPRLAILASPLAVAAVMVAALTASSYRMVGAVFGQGIGLSQQEISLFLAAFIAGGAVSQYPLGWIADAFDRRRVLIGLSIGAIVTAFLLLATQGWGITPLLICSALFGFATMPMFSVAASHANDFATDAERVELAAALMFFYALGGILSPVLGSALISVFGPSSLFVLLSLGHLALIAFGFWRMRSRAARDERTPYVYTPRSSFTIGKLLSGEKLQKDENTEISRPSGERP